MRRAESKMQKRVHPGLALLGLPKFAPKRRARQVGLWMRLVILWAAVLSVLISGPVLAQEQAWLQVEAQPSLAKAQDRARAYGSLFPDTLGFKIRSGWYAVVLGPQSPAAAAGRLNDLKRAGMIPQDSYITDGSDHREQFWPEAGAVEPETEVTPDVAATVEVAPEPLPEPVVDLDETPTEAKRSEAALSRDDRIDLQSALAWYGFYASALDGAIGPGTRKSMAEWQAANGLEATGILTSRQRATLVANASADKAEFGFETVTEAESGIEITLPLTLVAFDHYEPPFVHFAEKNGSGLRIILISQPGDVAALSGLYDVLQTLAVVPHQGERSKGEKSFTINALSDSVQSYAYAEASKGAVKGYLVVWNPEDAARMNRILPVLKASFRSVGDKALDPGLVPLDAATKAGLLAGLEVRKPKLSRSGFFVDQAGAVLTTAEAVASCGKITLEGSTPVSLKAVEGGLALLVPSVDVAPPAVAMFQTGAERIGAEVSVAGYSYEGKLPAPVLTFGTLEDSAGLNGEVGVKRLEIPVLAGDAGGPVLDASAAVIGMLLPRVSEADRKLPDAVEFAASGQAIAAFLAGQGIVAKQGVQTDRATPDALNRAALGMTVLVSCWE